MDGAPRLPRSRLDHLRAGGALGPAPGLGTARRHVCGAPGARGVRRWNLVRRGRQRPRSTSYACAPAPLRANSDASDSRCRRPARHPRRRRRAGERCIRSHAFPSPRWPRAELSGVVRARARPASGAGDVARSRAGIGIRPAGARRRGRRGARTEQPDHQPRYHSGAPRNESSRWHRTAAYCGFARRAGSIESEPRDRAPRAGASTRAQRRGQSGSAGLDRSVLCGPGRNVRRGPPGRGSSGRRATCRARARTGGTARRAAAGAHDRRGRRPPPEPSVDTGRRRRIPRSSRPAALLLLAIPQEYRSSSRLARDHDDLRTTPPYSVRGSKSLGYAPKMCTDIAAASRPRKPPPFSVMPTRAPDTCRSPAVPRSCSQISTI